MKKIAILQSNYIPWKGYFDFIDSVDEFIIYDTVQFTKGDWRNRNVIYFENKKKWLTIPIPQKGVIRKKINEIEVFDNTWVVKHLNQIQQTYKHTEFFDEVFPIIKTMYTECLSKKKLTDINLFLIKEINKILGISTVIKKSEEFDLISEDRNMRLVEICRLSNADVYVSGMAAKTYLNTDLFTSNNIEVEWMSYNRYPEYKQLNCNFSHEVSIIDLLMNVGLLKARSYIKTI